MTEPELLSLVPDIPRWVETRGMLLSGNYTLYQAHPDSPHFVLSRTCTPLISVIGEPSESLIRKAIHECKKPVEIVAQIENRDYVCAILSEWTATTATLFQLENAAYQKDISTDGVQLLEPRYVFAPDVPSPLRFELQSALAQVPVAATHVEGKAVSFCYPGSITETLWDISIDTLKPHRRKGCAEKCVAFLISRMRTLKKEPVWGSLNSNTASRKLAEKLGFRPVDWITVFQKNTKRDA